MPEPTPKRRAMDQTDIATSQFALVARELIKLITSLRALGAQADFDLPRIAVIGNQSAGKSSLVEAISGISVPRSHGTCTRCPMECRLTNSEEPWRCQILLRREMDETGQRSPTKEENFGPLLRDKSELEEMIRRAQLAVLNPGLSATFSRRSILGVSRSGRNRYSRPSNLPSPAVSSAWISLARICLTCPS